MRVYAGNRLLAVISVLLLCRQVHGLFGFFPDFPSPFNKNFQIYWNVPTFMCHKHGMDFEEVSREFGIIQNDEDQFRGSKIAILYDPGDFPAILEDAKGNTLRRNGGVPQEGNLTLHLDYFRKHVIEQIKNVSFDGLAIIDFESWRPVFRQNWSKLQPYKDLSVELETWKHPFWSKKWIQNEAEKRFEFFGRKFMEETLKLAKSLRKKAKWGYYAYPYCYNWTPKQQATECNPKIVEENDGMPWLFGSEDMLLPSVYLQSKLSTSQRIGLVRGRIEEAVRLRRKFQNPGEAKVFAYFWYKYQDQRGTYLDEIDIDNTIGEISRRGGDGLVIWGSSNDLNSKSKCQKFHSYLLNTLGPSIIRIRNQAYF